MPSKSALEPKPSWWARSLSYSAYAAMMMLIAAPIGARIGLWSFGPGLIMLAGVALLSTLTVVLSLTALLLTRGRARSIDRNLGYTALIIALLPAIIVDLQIIAGTSLPVIHDITTDTSDPPQFRSAPVLNASRMNSLEYAGDEVAAQQRAAYPDLDTLGTDLSVTEALTRAKQIANALGWDVVHENADQGRLEAVDTTFWFGFKDDIAVRVRATEGGSRVDLRSVSRVGKSDLGKNAERIRRFGSRFVAVP